MKNTQFVIFFSVFLTLYSLINVYIFFKGWQLFPRPSVSRALYSLLFFTVAFAYVAGRLLEKASICRASSALIWIGSFWLAFMVYLFLGFLLVDTISFVAGFNSTFRRHISSDSGSFRVYSAVAIYCITFLAVFIGHINTYRPAVTTVDIEIKGKSTPLERLNIALVTDIHLGTIVSNSKLTRMVEMVNALQPDIVLLAGDIVDEDIAPVIKNNHGDILRTMRSRLGVFAVTGNHEFYGGVDDAERYLAEHGIPLLRDRAILLDNAFYLAGRDDRAILQVLGARRAPLESILRDVDFSKPVIMMDHRPQGKGNDVDGRIDLLVSGHTHHGQMWPFNYVTTALFHASRGYRKTGNTHLFVSSGFGTWGPPVRIGTRPEIVNLRIRFFKTRLPETDLPQPKR